MTQDTLTYPLKWDLDCFFKGSEFDTCIEETKKNLAKLHNAVEKKLLEESILLSEKLSEALQMIDSFVLCKLSEDTRNTKAIGYQEVVKTLAASLEKADINIDDALKSMSPSEFDTLIKSENIKSLAFVLKERKIKAEEMLSKEIEELITDLSIDGYHGFSQMFYILHSRLKFPFRGKDLSYSQIENKTTDANKDIRDEAFTSFKEVFKEHESHFAEILNHIAGYRLKVYEKRGWDSPIKEPLSCNRMSEETLNSMLSAIRKNGDPLVDFLKRKAKLLGKEKLSWQDVDAPLKISESKIPYDDAAEEILKQFANFSPRKAAFCKKVLDEAWVEAEDRKHKGAGGFCIGFSKEKQSRIFMTYSGTQHNVATLAHELGHCYHNEVINEHSFLNQDIKMNVAETASTMAEMIVNDAALEMAKTKEDKIALMDDKLTRTVSYLMNLPARFMFEKSFYEMRKSGYVLPEKLNELMVDAQKICYKDSLEDYYPHFWASKLHFYFTEVPFYNFPYTFGFLFSLGIYSMFKDDLKSFETKYDALLYDTPLMTTEDLAKKHLGVDLTKETFWESAVKEAVKDVNLFLDITKA